MTIVFFSRTSRARFGKKESNAPVKELGYRKDSNAAAHSVDGLVWVCFHMYKIYIICILKEITHERETILTR